MAKQDYDINTNGTQIQKTSLRGKPTKGTVPIKNKYIYISIAAILIIASIVTITFLVSGRGKNVKDLYFQTEAKIFVNYMNDIIKKQNDSTAKTKPLREQPSRTRHEISVSIDDKDTFLNLPRQAIDVINSSKLVLNSRYDLKNDIGTGSLSFLLEGQSFLDIYTFLDKDIMGLQIPVLYDKYFVFGKNDVSHALSRFGIITAVNRILLPSEIDSIIKIPPMELKYILTDYIKFLEDSITDKHVSITRNVKLKHIEYPSNVVNPVNNQKPPLDKIPIESETIFQQESSSKNKSTSGKYNIFTVKLNEDEFKEVAKKTVDAFCTDKKLFNITLEKMYLLLEMLKDAGYFDLSENLETIYNQAKIYKDTERLKKDLFNLMETTSFPEGFNMTLTVDKDGNMADRKVYFTSNAEGEPKRMFNIHAGQFFTKLFIEQESSSNGKNGEQNKNALIKFEIVMQDGVGGKFIHINCMNNIWSDFEALINTRKISSEDNKKKTLNTNYILDIDLTCKELGMEKGNILIDVKREDKYGIDFELPDINKDTSIDMNSISEAGINKVKTEIQFSSAKFLLTNQYLINAFTSED